MKVPIIIILCLLLFFPSAYCCKFSALVTCVSVILWYHNMTRAAATHTVSGRIGKVVASHAAVARSSPAEVTLIYTIHEALSGYCP